MTTIVVVDDSVIELATFTEGLNSAGFETIGINDPTLAMEKIRSAKPDFIILDIQMPNKSGLELCHELKTDKETRMIPVLFLSSCNDPESLIATIHLGSIEYIRKPVTTSDLIRIVRHHDIAKRIADIWKPVREEANRILNKCESRSSKRKDDI